MSWEGRERRQDPPPDFGPMVEAATQKAIERVLTRLGVDHQNPLEMQEDMAFLRKNRKGAEQAGMWARRTILVAFLSGLIWASFEGIKHIDWK